ncbi:thioredoxin fold domain-containing protein [Photobacterium damselae]|uniref:thioredoxin fold domain-containing protein n=1 Tax=Photobacterium damselae TaxID=38293 RepID=UPI00406898BC
MKRVLAKVGFCVALAVTASNSLAATNSGLSHSNNQINLQTAKLDTFHSILNLYGDLAVKLGNNSSSHEIIFFYDNSCKYCNRALREIPQLINNGINVYVVPFLNHGFYTPNAKKMFAAWSTEQPIVSLLEPDTMQTVTLNRAVAEKMASLTQYAQNTLKIHQTPYMIFSNGEFIDGYASANDLINYFHNH